MTRAGIVPKLFLEICITLSPKLNKDAVKKRELQVELFKEYGWKNPQQDPCKQKPPNQMDEISWSTRLHLRDTMMVQLIHINKCISKDKNHMVISIDTHKDFNNNQHSFMILKIPWRK